MQAKDLTMTEPDRSQITVRLQPADVLVLLGSLERAFVEGSLDS